MDGIYQAWQTGLLWVCLCALGAMAAWLFLAKVAAPAWDAVRRWWSLPCIQRILVGVCVVGLSYYGATKQGWHVAYDGGIKAGATANVVTNDTVSIHWQRDTSGGVYVPETATVYIDYRPNTETNAEWGLLAQTTVGAWGWSGTVENATNYDYNVWAYYIPPEPVHTNGVWTYKTHFDRNERYALPLRARVEVNGVAIATPAEKRKDAVPTARDYIQDGLVAMWDGIENAGWGVHNPNAVTWVNLAQDKWHLAYNFNSARIEDNALFIIGGGYGAADISVGPPPDIWSLRTIEAVFKWDKVKRYNAHFIFSANPYPGEVDTIAGSTGKGLFWEGNSKIVADIRNENGRHQGVGISANQYIANTIATVSADFGASFSEGISRITLNGSNAGATTGAARIDRGYFRIGGANETTHYSLDNGAVYCIRVYSRLLTDDEIEYNRNIDKRRFTLP